MHKYFLLACTIIATSVVAAHRSNTPIVEEDRCAHCDKNRDDHTGQLLASNAFNVIINGFIAAQSGDNPERQNQAVVNALSSVSNIFQIALRNTNHTPEEAERLSREILEILRDPENVRIIAGHLSARRSSFNHQ